MKKIFFLFFLFTLFGCVPLAAQLDTLITWSNKKIICKIAEISENDIKYVRTDYLGEHYQISDKSLFSAIHFSNGLKETFEDKRQERKPDSTVIQRPHALKVEPFSPLMNKFVIGFEQKLKMGKNLEFKLGYINNDILQIDFYPQSYSSNYYTYGFFAKAGLKFIFGQDYKLNGTQLKHPLKGFYIRTDLSFASFVSHNVDFFKDGPRTSPWPSNTIYKTQDLTTKCFGILGNIGYQVVIANIICIDLYGGLGIAIANFTDYPTSFSFKYDPNSLAINNGANYQYCCTILRGSVGPCVNAGLSVGVILK